MTPRFRGTLAISPYPDGRTWYLDRAFAYVRDGMTIKVPRGFETDLASVPRVLWNVFPPWDTYGPAAVVHDWLYWSQPVTRDEADAIFREAMSVLLVPRWKAWSIYLGVHLGGQHAWDENASIGSAGYSRIRTPKSPSSPEWRQYRERI